MGLVGKSLLCLAAALGLAAGLVSGALADTATEKIGSPTGTPFSLQCPAGTALVGFEHMPGDHLMAIALQCQKIVGRQPTGPIGGALDTGTVVDGGKTFTGLLAITPTPPVYWTGKWTTCTNNGIMRSLIVYLTTGLRVHHIRAGCKAEGHAPDLIKGTIGYSQVTDNGSGVSCDNNTSYATGLVGTYKKSVQTGGFMSLGLLCFSGDSADNADNGNADTADVGDGNGNNDAGNLQIDMSNNGVKYGAKGKTRALRDDSTLYSDLGNTEIAYFNAGDRIVVVACEDQGQGWCQVIKPKAGLIWGGDLQ